VRDAGNNASAVKTTVAYRDWAVKHHDLIL
jgi:hypothetical protein